MKVVRFVIRSGSGFLREPRTLLMVGNFFDPAAAAIEAHRYKTRAAAAADMSRLIAAGFEAELTELNIIRR